MISRIDVISGRELTPEHLARWRRIQSEQSLLHSPYFCPEFTTLTAAVRDDVEVGLLYDERDGLAGFFPFQRQSRWRGRPVGGPLSDYQGLIRRAEGRVDPKELLRGCKLRSWEFDHLLADQPSLQPYHEAATCSPVIDLSQGYAAYRDDVRRVTRQLATVERKRRKMTREIGPLRFEVHVTDEGDLERLFQWKSEQYRRTENVDVFAYPWTKRLLRRILATQTEDFAGLFSTLHVGDELLAAHLGMRSRTVWHYWFPAYNQQFRKFSPGLLLLLEMVKHAPSLGLQIIDLGKDDARYKRQFSNASVPLAEGSVPRRDLQQRLSRTGHQVAEFIRGTPLAVPARIPSRVVRRVRTWMRYR